MLKIVVTDFDGTITIQDSNALLVDVFGDNYNQAIERQFIAGQMGTREAMYKHFQNLNLTEQEYTDFICNNIQIDPGFTGFYSHLQERQLPLSVISGGYINAIAIILGREGIKPTEVLANKLVFSDNEIENHFYHPQPSCSTGFGPCGNCKASHIQRYKEQYKQVLFIGDGLTDRCGAKHADVVYAKGRLAAYCQDNNLPYTGFKDFTDLTMLMFGSE